MRYALSGRCSQTVEPTPDGPVVVFTGPCMVTGKPHTVRAPKSGVDAYAANPRGSYIQTVFPDMSADDREFLISGISPDGWKQTFPDE